MNIDENLITVEEEMLSVIQKLDGFIDYLQSTGNIGKEEFLYISPIIRKYAEEHQNIIESLKQLNHK